MGIASIKSVRCRSGLILGLVWAGLCAFEGRESSATAADVQKTGDIPATLPSATTQPDVQPDVKPVAPDIAVRRKSLADLNSQDPARVASALNAIRAASVKRGRGWFTGYRAVEVLIDAQRYDDADQIALSAIESQPTDAAFIANMEKVRAKALELEGRADEGLAAAKSCYNVVPLANTQDAINLVATVLAQARPDDSTLADRFLRQQVAWASAAPTTQPDGSLAADPDDLGAPILPTIKIDPAIYSKSIDGIFPDRITSALARGNLLLVAGRAAEAHQLFSVAAKTARNSHELGWCVDGVARSIRAESGCIAPANTYIVSLRSGTQGGPQ